MADKSNSDDKPTLFPVGDVQSGSKRVADVVFVHGFRGGAHKTWMADEDRNETFWPRWLAELCPELGVWTYDYQTRVFDWLQEASPIDELAKSFLLDLASNDLGIRPLVFIAHSLGGIITKQALIKAQLFKDGQFSKLANNTVGLQFIAVPHHGSHSANWINAITLFTKKSKVLKQLRWGESTLNSLHEDFRAFCHNRGDGKIFIQSFCETKKLDCNVWGLNFLFSQVVVEKASADPGIGSFFCYEIKEDHIGICKPLNRDTSLFKYTLHFIKQSLSIVSIKLSIDEHKNEDLAFDAYDEATDKLRILESITQKGVYISGLESCSKANGIPCKIRSNSVCLVAELIRTLEALAEIREFMERCNELSQTVDRILNDAYYHADDEGRIGKAAHDLSNNLAGLVAFSNNLARSDYSDNWKQRPLKRLRRFSERRLQRTTMSEQREKLLRGLRRELIRISFLMRRLQESSTSWQAKGRTIVTGNTYMNTLSSIQQGFRAFKGDLGELMQIIERDTRVAITKAFILPNLTSLPNCFVSAIRELPYYKDPAVPIIWKRDENQ